MEAPDFAAHQMAQSQSSQGLTFAASVVLDPVPMELQFGEDLRRHGIVPIWIHMENRSPAPAHLSRDKLRLLLESGETLEPVSQLTVVQELRRSTTPAWLLAPLILPAIAWHREIVRFNFEMGRNVAAKALPPTLRLEPQDPPLCRAVFFRDPLASQRTLAAFASSTLLLSASLEGVSIEAQLPAAAGASRETPAPTEMTKSRPLVGSEIEFTLALPRFGQ